MKIQTEIITIGDELLIGQVVDTNSAWMGKQLNAIGIRVNQITSVTDNQEHILSALRDARSRSNIILITGGLGPTKDDITRETLCKFFNTGLKFDEASYQNIKRIFNARGFDVSALNRKQAEVPENCIPILNRLGTAPGMWFDEHEIIYVAMPGVPYEMKGIMESYVLPQLREKFKLPPIVHKTILTHGIGESYLSELIASWEDNLPAHLKLAYLPATGLLRLRISASGKDESKLLEEIKNESEKLESIAGQYIYGYGDDSLEAIIGRLLREKGKTLCTAESCTGGYIAHRITTVPGSSDYYIGSVVAYANQIKESVLNLDSNLFRSHGAVSEPVVRAMAENANKLFHTDFSIATTGIAGPGGATPEKPVGLVWIAVSSSFGTTSKKLQLGGNRERTIIESTQHGLNMLRKILLEESL